MWIVHHLQYLLLARLNTRLLKVTTGSRNSIIAASVHVNLRLSSCRPFIHEVLPVSVNLLMVPTG